MNQPSSRCNGWVDQLVQIGEMVEPGEVVVQEQAKFGDRHPPSPRDHNFDHSEGEMDVETETAPQSSCVDEFPGAAVIHYEQDSQMPFLKRFDQDRFSQERRSNLYYPFASRADWELGLWLTRSGLSIAAINSLLSLDLVSPMTLQICDRF